MPTRVRVNEVKLSNFTKGDFSPFLGQIPKSTWETYFTYKVQETAKSKWTNGKENDKKYVPLLNRIYNACISVSVSNLKETSCG